MEIKVFHENSSMPNDDYVDFIHSAFKERLEQKIYFGCATFSLEQFHEVLKRAYIVIVYDDNSRIVGTVSLTFVKKYGIKYGVHEYLAVSPNFRGKEIGNMLELEVEQIARDNRLLFLLSDTAFPALSSVRFHEKHGFKKLLVRSYLRTNYYSFVFLKVIRFSVASFFLFLFRLPCFFISYLLCKSFYRVDGTKRFFS